MPRWLHRRPLRQLRWWFSERVLGRPFHLRDEELEREAEFLVESHKGVWIEHQAAWNMEPLSMFFDQQAGYAREEPKTPNYVSDIYLRASERASAIVVVQSKMRRGVAADRRLSQGSGRAIPAPRARESRPQRRGASASSSSSSSSGGGDPPDDPAPEPPLVRGPGVARGRLGVEEAA